MFGEWQTGGPRWNWWRAWGASVLLHALVIAALVSLPKGLGRPLGFATGVHIFTPLIEPASPLTQTAPNRGRVAREFNLESLLRRPALKAPAAGGAPERRGEAAMPEPPKLEGPLARVEPPPLGSAPLAPPPPQIQPVEKPKLAFEIPGAPAGVSGGAGKLAPPSPSVEDAVRAAARRGPSGGLIVGDIGPAQGLDLPPMPGKTGSSVELLSDPLGVDFRPYLIQILAAVRRNWLAVIPESAKLGRRGRVQIQFAIDREGRVPKLVIALPSGADALDRAAVAGISASNPFPPLPAEFRGAQVRLQFTFFYNMAGN